MLGVETIAISSNDVITHPQDGPEKMAEDARSFGIPLTLAAPGGCELPKFSLSLTWISCASFKTVHRLSLPLHL